MWTIDLVGENSSVGRTVHIHDDIFVDMLLADALCLIAYENTAFMYDSHRGSLEELGFTDSYETTAVAWETVSNASQDHVIYHGSKCGSIRVFRMRTSGVKYNMSCLGAATVESPILQLKPFALGLLATCSDRLHLFQKTSFEPLLCLNLTNPVHSMVHLTTRSLLYVSGSNIKFWNKRAQKKPKVKTPARKVKYTMDKSLNYEIADIVTESQSSYQERVQAHRRSEQYNGADHGMSPRELEDYALFLSLQDSFQSGANVDDQLPSDLTEDELLQIALLRSQDDM
jgi:hypothetical protein